MVDASKYSLDDDTEEQVRTVLDMNDTLPFAYDRTYNHTQLPIAQGVAMNRASIPEPDGSGDNYSDDFVINTSIKNLQDNIQAPKGAIRDPIVELNRNDALETLSNAHPSWGYNESDGKWHMMEYDGKDWQPTGDVWP